MSLVITGPPPIFPYQEIRECSIDDRASCRLERASFAPVAAEVLRQLAELESRHPNIAVFDIFGSVCPSRKEYCYPDNGRSFLFRDQDHFNSLGSRLLAEPFVDRLRASGLIAPGT